MTDYSHLSDRDLETLYELKLWRHRTRSIEAFTKYTFPEYQANWHHKILCKTLEDFVFGNVDRLIVQMPPRTGKSELVSRRLPAFILGNNPDAEILCCSYGAELSAALNMDVQRIVDSPEYRKIFPDTRIGSKGYRRTSEFFEVVQKAGSLRSVGVGGSMTGHGANYLIIDDPLKNSEEAESQTIRDKLWNWYTSTAYTRLEGRGKVLFTMTRWHGDDIVGRVLKKDPTGWTVIRFPAICDEPIDPRDTRKLGEPLWPDKYPQHILDEIRATLGSYQWNSLYQQHPSIQGGSIIKRQWFKFYKALPAMATLIQSWDLTFKDGAKSDYVVGTVWGKALDGQMYLVDLLREKLDFPSTIAAFETLTRRHPKARAKYVEDKANGPALISTLTKRIPGIIPSEPRGDKVSRLNAVAPFFEAGNVYFPDPSIAPWIDEYMTELLDFPKGRHDDQVDATSMALVNLGDNPRDRLSKLLQM